MISNKDIWKAASIAAASESTNSDFVTYQLDELLKRRSDEEIQQLKNFVRDIIDVYQDVRDKEPTDGNLSERWLEMMRDLYVPQDDISEIAEIIESIDQVAPEIKKAACGKSRKVA
jgi:hypothetical protein